MALEAFIDPKEPRRNRKSRLDGGTMFRLLKTARIFMPRAGHRLVAV